ncbi:MULTISPECIES: CCA tRNA nucleotidyltransferase [Terrabacteria group]|uniref:CCA tRNA nucleotidyltransferase n=1 Tax=Bacillati TaxID=1783272 RepID=UPI001C6DDD24|nr:MULTISPECIES: CCA tRNA nucleotidyltransferase [Terrabacteria group]MBW9212921.1 CCA tRNA nucleotidyltransferase [Trueperella sp. zg.1013]
MELDLPKYVQELMQELESHGYEAYLVGGAIRNHLLAYPIKDYDLTTNATPEEMVRIFKQYPTIPTGIQHGTLTVLSKGHSIEITTYRVDGEYRDHRHPKQVQFSSSLQEDCARRDFTINALCYSKKNGLVDFFHGQKDLKEGCVRCIGNAQDRFKEDALRILRALRFAARLNFTIEEETAKAMFAKKNLLAFISKERIHAELTQLFTYTRSGQFLKQYFTIFVAAIPALANIQKEVVFKAIQKEPLSQISRLAILFSTVPNYHSVLKDFTFSNQEIHQIENILQYQSLPLQEDYDGYRILSYFENIEDYLLYRTALDASLDGAQLSSWFQKLKEKPIPTSLSQLQFTGHDAQALGYKGIEIKHLLQELLNLCMQEKLKNAHPILWEYAQKKFKSK